MPLQELTVVESAAALRRALTDLDGLSVVGIDVERADWNRYYRAAALVQVGGEGRVVVIDPLAFSEFDALSRFLERRVVAFHAMENDLGPLATLGVEPAEIEDTAVAAAMLGMPTGLEHLLGDVLDVQLAGDKQAMQRADWEARPLDEAMLTYAAGDVADLPRLWVELSSRLDRAGRLDWYRQERDATRMRPSVEERRDWSRTRGVGRLDRLARTRLRYLWDTRERLARETDTAPGRIAGDRVLLDLAVTPPEQLNELGRRGVRRQAARRFGADLIAALEAAGRADAGGRTEATSQGGPLPEHRTKADGLRALRAQRATELGIDPGVLCPSRTLLAAVASEPATAEALRAELGLLPWQWEQVGAAFCDALGLEGPGKPTARDDLSTGDEETA